MKTSLTLTLEGRPGCEGVLTVRAGTVRGRRRLIAALLAAATSGTLAGCGLNGSLTAGTGLGGRGPGALTAGAPGATPPAGTTGDGSAPGTTSSGATSSGGAPATTSSGGTTTSGGGTATGSGGGTTTGSGTTTTVLPGTGRPTVFLGDENTPEQFILGELYRVALTDEGYSLSISQNIGTPAISLQALEQRTLSIYPAYLNQWDSAVAGDDATFATRDEALGAAQTFAAAHGLELLDPTPFSDTTGLAVTTQYAGDHRLRTLADLAHLASPFTVGGPVQFAQPGGGLPEIEHAYGFLPTSTQTVAIGSQYAALAAGTIQAAYVNTTDYQLATGQFTLLRDPLHILGFGNVVPVTTDAVVSATGEGPTFSATINRVDALLTTKVMRELNVQVELLNETPEEVATTFLAEHGILPPPIAS